MIPKTYSVFSDSLIEDKSLILEIKNFINHDYPCSDFTVFSSSNNTSEYIEFAILVSFYLRFFNGDVVFLHIDDYYAHKDHILGRPILYLDSNNMEQVDRNSIKGCDILTRSQDNKLIIINNNELQQTI